MKNNSKSKTASTNNKYAEDWLPVRSIVNGAIQLNNGLSVTGVKITPRNIFILDYESQNNVIFNLRNFYNMLDYEFWLIVTDRPVDINLYMSQLQLQLNSAQNMSMRKLILEDIRKAETFMSKEVNVVDTEYFILFKDKRPDIIAKRVQNLISGLAPCGLQARKTTNDDLRALLDSFFNSSSKTEFGAVLADE